MAEYPLQELVLIKQKRMEEAEKVLRDKKQALEKEQEKLGKIEEERKKVKIHKDDKLQQLRETLDKGSTSDKIQQMKQYLKVVDERLKIADKKVKDQEKVVSGCETAVNTARDDLFKKQQDVEKLELHRKEWEKEMRYLEVQEEGRHTDEMGSAIHHIKKRKKH